MSREDKIFPVFQLYWGIIESFILLIFTLYILLFRKEQLIDLFFFGGKYDPNDRDPVTKRTFQGRPSGRADNPRLQTGFSYKARQTSTSMIGVHAALGFIGIIALVLIIIQLVVLLRTYNGFDDENVSQEWHLTFSFIFLITAILTIVLTIILRASFKIRDKKLPWILWFFLLSFSVLMIIFSSIRIDKIMPL